MRAGDYLFIQFGHNDQKSQADIDNYKANLMRYITDARAKSVTPVLFTPVARKGASTASPGFAGLDQQARDLAAAQNVALVDLTSLSLAHYRTVSELSSLFALRTDALRRVRRDADRGRCRQRPEGRIAAAPDLRQVAAGCRTAVCRPTPRACAERADPSPIRA
jgi:GDSL-like Lipase/Acylhydrolase family